MHPLNPVFSVLVFLLAFCTARILGRFEKGTDPAPRNHSIEGLRGFLAIGVFIHHATIWHQYLHTEKWSKPQSVYYDQLGKISVTFFFMITSFLFIGKLVQKGPGAINWPRYFPSRLNRLVPMYWTAMSIHILILMATAGWRLHVAPDVFLKSLLSWYTFTFFANPGINGSNYTSIINAGVAWSLPLEWLFYCCLPIIAAVFFRVRVPWIYLGFGALISVLFFYCAPKPLDLFFVFIFLTGAIAAFLLRVPLMKRISRQKATSVAVLLLIALSFPMGSQSRWLGLAMIAGAFCLIATACPVFGILHSRTLRFLGEIAYSTYLLHGIVLFVTMYFGFGLRQAAQLSPTLYCLCILFLTPIVVILSYLGFRFIERPFMRRSSRSQLPAGQLSNADQA